jgi:hypothetical protein
MEDTLRESVRGQDEALNAVSNAVRMQRAGLKFFLPGPDWGRKNGGLQKNGKFLIFHRVCGCPI